MSGETCTKFQIAGSNLQNTTMEQAFAQVGREVQALAEDAALARKRLILRVEHGINCGYVFQVPSLFVSSQHTTAHAHSNFKCTITTTSTAPVAEDVNVVAFLRRLRVLEERLPALARNAAKLQQRRMVQNRTQHTTHNTPRVE